MRSPTRVAPRRTSARSPPASRLVLDAEGADRRKAARRLPRPVATIAGWFSAKRRVTMTPVARPIASGPLGHRCRDAPASNAERPWLSSHGRKSVAHLPTKLEARAARPRPRRPAGTDLLGDRKQRDGCRGELVADLHAGQGSRSATGKPRGPRRRPARSDRRRRAASQSPAARPRAPHPRPAHGRTAPSGCTTGTSAPGPADAIR